jgi:hypothetical protein
MSTKQRACQAKNPSRCSYHGSPDMASNSLKERVKNLTAGKPVYFEAFSHKAKKLTGSVVVTPFSAAAKSQPVYIDLEGDSYDDLQNQLGNTLEMVRLKDLKTGYKADITLPSSSNKDAVPVKFYESTSRSKMLDDPSVTEDGVPGFKQAIMARVNSETRNNEVFDTVINRIKDTSVAQSVSGAKSIAVVEAMNEFKYFHLRKDNDAYEVTAAFNSILNKTSEYTNRGYGIRAYFNYKNNGELSGAEFSLDREDSPNNAFTPEQVKGINKKLKKYFDSFDN